MQFLSLDEIHYAESEMLRWLDSICRDNNIPLCLAGGTLLGAIRHHGFIPWDDDIDLIMPRSEYDKMIDIVGNIKHDRYQIVSLRDGKSTFAYAKIIDKAIFLQLDKRSEEITSNLWIDIFPVDGLPNEERNIKKTFAHAKFLRMSLKVSSARDLNAGSTLKKIVKPFVVLPSKVIGAKKWVRLLDNYCRKIPFGSTKYVGVLCGGYGYRECMPAVEWTKYTEVDFEGGKYLAPGCWQEYLEKLYGDYMKLPPEEKRHMHNVVAFIE